LRKFSTIYLKPKYLPLKGGGGWADGESTPVGRLPPLRGVVNPKGGMGGWGDGETRGWGEKL